MALLPRPRPAARLLTALLTLLALLGMGLTPDRSAGRQPAAGLDVRPGDRISILGNTLADRMQHDGWLETFFHTRFPKHDLVFRHLGFAADELKTRLRSKDFGSPDQWLTRTKADVVFAFFGYNESFAGARGLPKFKEDLDAFVKHTLKQQYNGQGPPRLVLF